MLAQDHGSDLSGVTALLSVLGSVSCWEGREGSQQVAPVHSDSKPLINEVVDCIESRRKHKVLLNRE
jgi:hypothetical protein